MGVRQSYRRKSFLDTIAHSLVIAGQKWIMRTLGHDSALVSALRKGVLCSTGKLELINTTNYPVNSEGRSPYGEGKT